MSAKPLEWEDCDGVLQASSINLAFGIDERASEVALYFSNFKPWKSFKTVDAAKAHAEQLHQQAWRELRTKWDAV